MSNNYTLSPLSLLKGSIAATAIAFVATSFAGNKLEDDAQVIELTQVNCQFVESENGVNHGYSSTEKADCDRINEQTVEDRLAAAKTLELKPGKYIFRVTNVNVEYPLGFYLRGDGIIDSVTLPKVSGGGLTLGVTKDYEIELEEGEYVYSCPLNSTPDYKLVVSNS